jgi:hypothetical protein
MKQKKVYLIFVIAFAVLFWNFVIYQNWKPIIQTDASKELLEINSKILEKKEYSFKVLYSSYKGHDSNELHEQYSGEVIRSDMYYRSDIMNKIVIQNKEFRIIVDKDNKIVKVNDPIKNPDPILDVRDFEKAMDICKQVKRCVDKNEIGYRFELKVQRGIVSQEVFFNESFISRLVYYYVNEHSVRQNNLFKTEIVYPKLIIEFKELKFLNKVNKGLFETASIVIIQKGKLVLANDFKNYKLIDGRYYK